MLFEECIRIPHLAQMAIAPCHRLIIVACNHFRRASPTILKLRAALLLLLLVAAPVVESPLCIPDSPSRTPFLLLPSGPSSGSGSGYKSRSSKSFSHSKPPVDILRRHCGGENGTSLPPALTMSAANILPWGVQVMAVVDVQVVMDQRRRSCRVRQGGLVCQKSNHKYDDGFVKRFSWDNLDVVLELDCATEALICTHADHCCAVATLTSHMII